MFAPDARDAARLGASPFVQDSLSSAPASIRSIGLQRLAMEAPEARDLCGADQAYCRFVAGEKFNFTDSWLAHDNVLYHFKLCQNIRH